MKNESSHIDAISNSMEDLIMRMKEVDDRCVDIQENISIRELNLIRFVGKEGSAKMSEIAEFLDTPMSTATGIVDKLVTKAYLKRAHSQTDRRIVCIELDSSGEDTIFLFNNMRQEIAERILSLLNEKEIKVFIGLIEKITDGLNAFVEVKQ